MFVTGFLFIGKLEALELMLSRSREERKGQTLTSAGLSKLVSLLSPSVLTSSTLIRMRFTLQGKEKALSFQPKNQPGMNSSILNLLLMATFYRTELISTHRKGILIDVHARY